MGKSKFGIFVLLGALGGGLASFLHKPTRENVINKSKKTISTLQHYNENKDMIGLKIQNEKEKYENLFEKITNDVMYFKDKLEDFKTLTPQVKQLIDQTKDAVNESKDEFKKVMNDTDL